MARSKEGKFQDQLILDLEFLFPQCVTVKGNSGYRQGFPDISIYWGKYHALLECKKSADEPFQPNQEYYISLMQDWGIFAEVIYPENKEEILYELQRAFGISRPTRLP